MKHVFTRGDRKQFMTVVKESDLATFEEGNVHPVYSTFALARDLEWTTRLFVLDMRDDDEEGIGTFVHVNHHAPAFVGEQIFMEGTIEEINGNELICSVTAHAGDRLVATGRTGQRILKKEKIKILLQRR